MNKTFNTVIFTCFTPKQVKEINKTIEFNILQEEESISKAESTKTGKFFHVSCLPLMDLLHPWIYQCQRANSEIFGYDIYWLYHLDSFNYNVHGTNDQYEWHVDGNKTSAPNDLKLTCLLNLSEEPYEGGEFYTINSYEKEKFDSGMGLIVTSLLAHKVTPVTKGERITLTYFAKGPSWR